MSGGRRRPEAVQRGGLRGSVWNDRGKEPKSRQVQLLNCGRVATGLGIDTVHPAPNAGLRVQRSITHRAVAEVATAADAALRAGPAIQLQSHAPPRLCLARPRH